MSLKLLNDEDRILFLKEFVQELVINSAENERLKNLIESEKIKRRYIDTEKESDLGKRFIFNTENSLNYLSLDRRGTGGGFSEFSVSEISNKPHTLVCGKTQEISDNGYEKSRLLEKKDAEKRKIIFRRNKVPVNVHRPIFASSVMQKLIQKPEKIESENIRTQRASQFPETISPFKKIEFLIKDPGMQLIECSGPGKNILVKVRNKINTTKISLTEEDISGVIDYFSNEAKIPVLDGILKAAVGELVISAVISKYAGSRFIITKKSPYSLIEEG